MAFYVFPGNGFAPQVSRSNVIYNPYTGDYIRYDEPAHQPGLYRPACYVQPTVNSNPVVIGSPIGICVGQVTYCSRCGRYVDDCRPCTHYLALKR
jgi:hypothetical protein